MQADHHGGGCPNGEDVLNSATVRFEAAIGAENTARMGTPTGRTLEFGCGSGGQEMSVGADPPKPDYASGT